ncbi:MAG TPA: O-antigen ligase family protein [Candidatus Avoscillospira avicola]|uniref:O-antigen ligase family protein n=1 Tax=Candidatus Avoscillospira avicola TaxID=2840706 RepID=A0A9D1DH44_9FIRM|nr:O-antigen ligase family protein [Candidatus Avoscillospira avicola]
MDEMLRLSLLWRVVAAIGAFFGRLASGSRFLAALGRWWQASGTRRFLDRRFSAEAGFTEASGYRRLSQRLNDRLAGVSRPLEWFRAGVVGRIWRGLFRWGEGSVLLGWMFRGGLTGVILTVLGLYCGVDYLLRDVFSVPVLSSLWDEALLLVSLLWILRLRMDRATPLEARTNPLDVPLLAFLALGFLLMNTVFDYYSISMDGYRATVQYMLWFFVVTRMLRNDRDFKTLYFAMVALATVIALHGIYQYIVAVPIPSNWTDQAEQSVRTRVFSIFGSPNIMGDYMVMFAPMAAGLAYYLPKTWQKLLAWACAFAMCFACLFTMSRGAWVAMAVAVVLFCLLVDRRLFALLVVAAVAAMFLPFVASRIGYLFTEQFAESTARGGRASRWHYGLNYLVESGHPWLGLGLGMFGGAIAMQTKIIDQWDYFYLDNYYLKIMVEMGYLGFIFFVVLLAALVLIGLRCVRRSGFIHRAGGPRMQPLAAGILSGLCGVLAHCYFENIFEEPYMMAYFWMMAAMLVYLGFFRPRAAQRAAQQ